MILISVFVGATAGWAAYFAWQYRDFVGYQEIAAGVLGAGAGVIVWSILAGERGPGG